MKKQKIHIIVGPTASGKSSLAFRMAKGQSGQIVNADAFQVYSGLRVLTARPTADEEKEIPHHLYGYGDDNLHIYACSVPPFNWSTDRSFIIPMVFIKTRQ